MEVTKTHGEKRLGLLTSSIAKTIMHGSIRGWESLSKRLWAESAEGYDHGYLTADTEYGKQHEAEGAAKFWERNAWVHVMREGTFFQCTLDGVPMGSSPDRILVLPSGAAVAGLEIKSPTKADTFDSHNLKSHWDQCQHGLLVSGLSNWYLFVHHGSRVNEWTIAPDADWQTEYLRRAKAFWNYHMRGIQP